MKSLAEVVLKSGVGGRGFEDFSHSVPLLK